MKFININGTFYNPAFITKVNVITEEEDDSYQIKETENPPMKVVNKLIVSFADDASEIVTDDTADRVRTSLL